MFRAVTHQKKLLIFIILLLSLFYAFVVLFQFRSNEKTVRRFFDQRSKVAKINPGNEARSGCRRPNLDPFAPSVKRFIEHMKPVECSDDQDWVVVSNSVAKISDHLKDSNIECSLTYLIRVDDDTSVKGKVVTLSSNNPEVTLEHDFFWVKCSDGSRSWSNIMAGIHRNNEIVKRAKKSSTENSQKLNILMFGYDSVARMHFIRQMPKSYKYLVEKMNAIVLETYNIVGDGTPQALIPILTSFAEPELPETRKRMAGAVYCNVYPFIWKNYTEKGYVTAWMEDGGSYGTFSYRLKGFKEPPTDHYGRSFDLEARKLYSKHKPYCFGSQSRHRVMTNWMHQFFQVYNDIPKFGFAFHSEYSHDSFNLLQLADDELLQWLQELQNDGTLENTILIVMSDHGNRFASIRETQQGKLEERLPYFSFVLPKWFKDKFPVAFANLQFNAKERLMTPFDLHATFLTVLNKFNRGVDVTNDKHYRDTDKLPRSMSLFEEIPEFRDCQRADIEAHWCTCLSWQSVDISDSVVQNAANTMVEYINSLTDPVRDLCTPLTVDRITRAERAQPNKNLLSFKQSKDHDGFVPDLTADTKVSDIVYQLQLVTSPSQGIYEATLQYNTALKSFKVTESQISRVNMYGNQPHCIYQTHQGLRKYCYCKQQI
ncbi:hypothetical protein B4U80_03084 [Leptotrombidium deliense]|uniref:DUF229 domain containing protein n=1 Tax=Leptotrombidium deliense TaxID=299467 RepID=A0A443SSX3_9ACAR|nr:hypothetical protein B4U80_03084 [Leptotrombidium deliense]